jgi:hypothetical protein
LTLDFGQSVYSKSYAIQTFFTKVPQCSHLLKR